MPVVIEHYKAARVELTAPGSPFEVVRENVMGSDILVFKSAPPSIRTFWEGTAVHGDKDYIVYEDERYTYAEIHSQVRRLATYLQAHGAVPGTRVALAMRNYPEWVVGYWACVSIGVAAVGMNAWWTAPEMEYALNDSDPVVFIGDDERLAQLAERPQMHVIAVRSDRAVPSNGGRWADVLATADPGSLPAVEIGPEDDATIFYTSGTTGFPKGAQLTHRGSVSNILNLVAMTTASSMAEQKAIARGSQVGPAGQPAVVHGAHPAVPRDRVQLHPASGDDRRRQGCADVQVGSGPCPRVDRAREGHQLLGCAHHEP